MSCGFSNFLPIHGIQPNRHCCREDHPRFGSNRALMLHLFPAEWLCHRSAQRLISRPRYAPLLFSTLPSAYADTSTSQPCNPYVSPETNKFDSCYIGSECQDSSCFNVLFKDFLDEDRRGISWEGCRFLAPMGTSRVDPLNIDLFMSSKPILLGHGRRRLSSNKMHSAPRHVCI